VTGESIFLTHFTNEGSGKKRVAFAAPYPGKIIPINLEEVNGELFCQKDAFLCAAMGTEIGIAFTKRMGTGFFGGEGFILQRLRWIGGNDCFDKVVAASFKLMLPPHVALEGRYQP